MWTRADYTHHAAFNIFAIYQILALAFFASGF